MKKLIVLSVLASSLIVPAHASLTRKEAAAMALLAASAVAISPQDAIAAAATSAGIGVYLLATDTLKQAELVLNHYDGYMASGTKSNFLDLAVSEVMKLDPELSEEDALFALVETSLKITAK